MSRASLDFSSVRSIVPIDRTRTEDLPSNMIVLSHHNPYEQYEQACRILRTQPEYNAIVLLPPKNHPHLTSLTSRFRTLTPLGKTQVLSIKRQENDPNRQQRMISEFLQKSRISYTHTDSGAIKMRNPDHHKRLIALHHITQYWDQSPQLTTERGVRAPKSVLKYNQEYSVSGFSFHIDPSVIDARSIENGEGPNTILCADSDFRITPNAKNTITDHTVVRRYSGITAWSLPRNASVIIRTGSQGNVSMGASPTVHAVGLVDKGGKAERSVSLTGLKYT